MSKTMRIIAVRRPTTALAKKPVPEYDVGDVDLFVNMVNKEFHQKEAERQARSEKDRIRSIELREKNVSRRERVIRRKELEYRQSNTLVSTVIDAAVIGFSIVGMVSTLCFFWFL